ncbi:MarR family winged helix-turn-helix transcriptional regulator [Parasphingorhabdus sp.]|uniref:MarR family winged helix-turn-helix transcriptional regulator n=1 Tax=Parasphingorhabdus sp. TaxID=2709688 RepID=UPI003A8DB3CD
MKNPLLMMNLLSAVYWFDEALQNALKEANIPNVTRAQSMLIANISAGESRATRIARNLGVTRQAISLMISELEARGIVETVIDSNDRRARKVRFPKDGNETSRAAAKILYYLESELIERIGLPKYHGLRDAMMTDWGEPPHVPPHVVHSDVSAPEKS